MSQDKSNQNEQQVVSQPVQETRTVVETPTTLVEKNTTPAVDHSDVREIQGGMTVVSGNPLKTYGVVVGSFVTQANAEGQRSKLQGQGYDARVVKTNETINGQTGWFRVVAASYDDKASAAQARNTLRATYPDAWLLYCK